MQAMHTIRNGLYESRKRGPSCFSIFNLIGNGEGVLDA
jgi:hypothetical protein